MHEGGRAHHRWLQLFVVNKPNDWQEDGLPGACLENSTFPLALSINIGVATIFLLLLVWLHIQNLQRSNKKKLRKHEEEDEAKLGERREENER